VGEWREDDRTSVQIRSVIAIFLEGVERRGCWSTLVHRIPP
jgi:hypothetical protein